MPEMEKTGDLKLAKHPISGYNGGKPFSGGRKIPKNRSRRRVTEWKDWM